MRHKNDNDDADKIKSSSRVNFFSSCLPLSCSLPAGPSFMTAPIPNTPSSAVTSHCVSSSSSLPFLRVRSRTALWPVEHSSVHFSNHKQKDIRGVHKQTLGKNRKSSSSFIFVPVLTNWYLGYWSGFSNFLFKSPDWEIGGKKLVLDSNYSTL